MWNHPSSLGINRTVALADLVKDIKVGTAHWIKDTKLLLEFSHWQDGYGAFTVGPAQRDAVIDYIRHQPEHHRHKSFLEEYRELLSEAGLEFDERHVP